MLSQHNVNIHMNEDENYDGGNKRVTISKLLGLMDFNYCVMDAHICEASELDERVSVLQQMCLDEVIDYIFLTPSSPIKIHLGVNIRYFFDLKGNLSKIDIFKDEGFVGLPRDEFFEIEGDIDDWDGDDEKIIYDDISNVEIGHFPDLLIEKLLSVLARDFQELFETSPSFRQEIEHKFQEALSEL